MQSVGFCLVVAFALCACGNVSSSGPQAQSVERQSESEYDLAREYFYKQRPREALGHALQADSLDDKNVKALYFTAAIYLQFCSNEEEGLKAPDCKMDQAELYARKTLERDEHFRDARNMLGNILTLEGKYHEAITTLEPLVKDPSYTASHLAWGNLGWAQVLEGHLDEGITSLRNSVTQPKFCVGFYRLGVAYEKKGDLSLAEQSFTSALEIPEKACHDIQEAWLERAQIRLKTNHNDTACVDLGECQKISTVTETGKACSALILKAGCAKAAEQATPSPSRRWT